MNCLKGGVDDCWLLLRIQDLPASLSHIPEYFFLSLFSGGSFTNHSEVGSIRLVQSSLPVLSTIVKQREFYPNLMARLYCQSYRMKLILMLQTGYGECNFFFLRSCEGLTPALVFL